MFGTLPSDLPKITDGGIDHNGNDALEIIGCRYRIGYVREPVAHPDLIGCHPITPLRYR